MAVIVVTSGCIAEEKTTAAGAKPEGPAAKPVVSDTLGALSGYVTDDQDLPLQDAEVGIPTLDAASTRSDDQGQFTLNGLPPGEYQVFAVRIGFEPAAAKAIIIAGDVTELDFRLVALPAEGPYSVTMNFNMAISGVMWKLTPSCIYTSDPLIKTCGGVRLGCEPDHCETHMDGEKEFTNEWQTIVGEVYWTAQSGVTGKGFSFDINAPNVTRGTSGSISAADPHQFRQAANKAPIRIQVDKSALDDRGIPESDWDNYDGETCTSPTAGTRHCDWFFRLFPAAYDLGIGENGLGPDYGVSNENPASVYFSYFIEAPAPVGFTAIPAG